MSSDILLTKCGYRGMLANMNPERKMQIKCGLDMPQSSKILFVTTETNKTL
jgi:hypothetical protein